MALVQVGANTTTTHMTMIHSVTRLAGLRHWSPLPSSERIIHSIQRRYTTPPSSSSSSSPSSSSFKVISPASSQRGKPNKSNIIRLSSPQSPFSNNNNDSPWRTATSQNSSLIQLRSSLSRDDLGSVWWAWNELENTKNLSLVSFTDHVNIARLCTSQVLASKAGGNPIPKEWHDQSLRVIRHSASLGMIEPFNIWAKCFLAAGDFQQVCSLFSEYSPSLLKTLVQDADEPSHSNEAPLPLQQEVDQAASLSLPTLQPSQSSPPSSNSASRIHTRAKGNIHDFVACVVIAKACLNDLGGLVKLLERAEFGSFFPLFYFQPERVQQLYKTLVVGINDDLSNRVAKFTNHAELARGISCGSGNSRKIAKLLSGLFRSRKTDSQKTEHCWTIFVTAMEASKGSQAWLPLEANDSSATTAGIRSGWTESCWALCLTHFIALERVDLALSVWSALIANHLKPTNRIWNALLDGYAKARNLEAAEKTWQQMMTYSNNQCRPDAIIYTTMINILFKAKKPEQALELFDQMKQRHDNVSDDLLIPAETCNAVVNGLCVNGRYQDAQQFVQEMQTKGPTQPTIGTINTLLRCYARFGNFTLLAATLRLVNQLQLEPDIVTFTTILDALLEKGGGASFTNEAVGKVLDVMEAMNVKANAVTYTAMIKACLKGVEASQLIDTQSPTGLVSSSSSSPFVPRPLTMKSKSEPKIQAAFELLQRMVKLRIEPTEVTYTSILAACLQSPSLVSHLFQKRMLPAKYLLAAQPIAMLGEDVNTVTRWMTTQPHVSVALVLFQEMQSRGLSPTATTYHYLIDGLFRCGIDRASFVRGLHVIDQMQVYYSLPSFSSSSSPIHHDRKATLGPWVSLLVRSSEFNTNPNISLRTLTHKDWIVLLTSLMERIKTLSNLGTDRQHLAECRRVLSWAVKVLHDGGSRTIYGSDGGSTLLRLLEKAARV